MRSELAETAFVTHCFSMPQNQRKAYPKPNVAKIQLPSHYSRNGCVFLANRLFLLRFTLIGIAVGNSRQNA